MSENRDTYIRVYDSLPREAKDAMQDLWMTGRNQSGVWVRFKDVEGNAMRLIDADALCEYANNQIDKTVDANDIMRFPRVDAVPVVRCRECKWGRTVRECSEYVWCGKPYAPPWASHKADWYCADGERKEDADEISR